LRRAQDAIARFKKRHRTHKDYFTRRLKLLPRG
jgi:hypothetical protein